MIKEAIKILVEGINLSEKEMIETMRDIMEAKATDAQIASFLTALRFKGETVEEITGAVKVMREKATKIKAPEYTVDTCGTGGDMSHTFNISTTSALIVAACGVPVAKHGNRSVSNPAGAKRQVLGVFDDSLTEVMAEVLANIGTTHAFIVHGEDGLDEITNTDKTKITELKNGRIDTYFITPEDIGFPRAKKEDLLGGKAEENAQIVIDIINGKKGPKRDITIMNASAALIIGDRAKSFSEAIEKASRAIDSGAALKKLEEIKVVSNRI